MVKTFRTLMPPKMREMTILEKIHYYVTYIMLATSLASLFSIIILFSQGYLDLTFVKVSSFFVVFYFALIVYITSNYFIYGEIITVGTLKKPKPFKTILFTVINILLTLIITWSFYENMVISQSINTMYSTMKKEELSTKGMEVGICSPTPFNESKEKTKYMCVAKTPELYKDKESYALYVKYVKGGEELIIYSEDSKGIVREEHKIKIK